MCMEGLCVTVFFRRKSKQHTLFIQNLGGASVGALVGGVVECAAEPRPRVTYVHVSSLSERQATLEQVRCRAEDGLLSEGGPEIDTTSCALAR